MAIVGGALEAAPPFFLLEFVNLFELPSVLQFMPSSFLANILHEPFTKWLGEKSFIPGLQRVDPFSFMIIGVISLIVMEIKKLPPGRCRFGTQ